MNLSTLIRFAVLMGLAAAAGAQNSLEIIALRHRTAEQVLPSLQPLLEPGGTLSGQGTQLFVRTSPANLDDLRLALTALDRPARRLQISVRYDQDNDAAARNIDASGRISDRGANVDVRAQDSRSQGTERVDQRVQTLDGAPATILTGASRPVSQRQYIQTPIGVVSQPVTVTRETASGVQVVPRLVGDRVQVEIVQQRETSASYQRASTVASGRLGEWFELGQMAMGVRREELGIGSANHVSGGETRHVWIRVDELP